MVDEKSLDDEGLGHLERVVAVRYGNSICFEAYDITQTADDGRKGSILTANLPNDCYWRNLRRMYPIRRNSQ